MLSSPIIDLAIGLTFVFGVTAALASLVTELISRLTGLRGAYLLIGLRELVDGGDSATNLTNVGQAYTDMRNLVQHGPAPAAGPAPAVTAALLGGPILGNQGVAGQLSSRKLTLGKTTKTGQLPGMTHDPAAGRKWSQLRSLPSYIPASSFADAVVDLIVPDPHGQTGMNVIEQGIGNLPDPTPFKASLQALVTNANGDVGRFRASVEKWYDDHMDRVSGWYKRRVAKITLTFGALIVVLLNLNAVTIGRTLYTESAVSAAISTVAAKASCPGEKSQDCLNSLEGQISAAAAAGLPVGWGTVRDCTEPKAYCGWWEQRGLWSRHGGSGWQLAVVLVGFLIMIFSVLPGAQFWFGLLSKLNALRATGPKPAAGQLF